MNSFFIVFISAFDLWLPAGMVRFVAHNSIFGGYGLNAARLCLASALGKKVSISHFVFGQGSIYPDEKNMYQSLTKSEQDVKLPPTILGSFTFNRHSRLGQVMWLLLLLYQLAEDWMVVTFFHKQWMKNETHPSVYCFLKCKSWEVHSIHGGPWETFPSNKDPTRSHNRPSARILACLLQARNGLRNGALWSQVELSCYFIGWCVGKYWQIWTDCQSRRVGRPECNFLGLGDQQSCSMKLWGQSCFREKKRCPV